MQIPTLHNVDRDCYRAQNLIHALTLRHMGSLQAE
jgi:hypothetical protein